ANALALAVAPLQGSGQFSTLPSTSPAAPCWARLSRRYAAGIAASVGFRLLPAISQVEFSHRRKRAVPSRLCQLANCPCEKLRSIHHGRLGLKVATMSAPGACPANLIVWRLVVGRLLYLLNKFIKSPPPPKPEPFPAVVPSRGSFMYEVKMLNQSFAPMELFSR